MNLAARLYERRREIEQAALARVYAVSDPAAVDDLEYVTGLRSAVASGLDHGLAAIETRRPPASIPVPAPLLAQARAAARNGVTLDTVLRRYAAGYSLLIDRILQEAQHDPCPTLELRRVLREEAALFDRLLSSVSEEYAREARERPQGVEQHRAERVRMLLAGELLDIPDLAYDLDAWHIGAIACGPGARTAIRDLATALDRRLLAISAEGGSLWAWLGGRRQVSAREALRLARSCWPAGTCLALGEPGHGLEGWRLTHRQARAAIAVAQRGEPSFVRYADVSILAAALRDDVLASSLRDTYLAPLEEERDGGATLRQTLHAYFGAERNASSAAAALGMSRNTVRIRLRTVEERIGRPVDGCAAELETALRLRELSHPHHATHTHSANAPPTVQIGMALGPPAGETPGKGHT